MGLEMFMNQNKQLGTMKISSYQMQETNSRLLFGFLVMFVYLLIGAITFVKIEAPAERIHFEAFKEFREVWIDKLVKVGMSEEDVDKMFTDIKDSALAGVWVENNDTVTPSWTFGKTFFFCATLISTVGYGTTSPKTAHGKLFTILYCIIGIPLTLSLLSALVFRLRQPSNLLKEKLSSKLSHIFHNFQIQYIHLAVISILVLIVAFIIPSYIFTQIESDWTFLDAFFYCFVSLSTIGLGDQTPGDNPDQSYRGFYKILVTAYLIFGLSTMMLFLATLYDIPQLNFAKFFITKNDTEYQDTEISGTAPTTTVYGKYKEEEDYPPLNSTATYPYKVENGYYH
uniref:Two pore potassium channel protein sup-9 n=1 Tax=Rhabditophanes sp. KR3021 TaxID=114890 RepID=A0AC35TV84_9BILA